MCLGRSRNGAIAARGIGFRADEAAEAVTSPSRKVATPNPHCRQLLQLAVKYDLPRAVLAERKFARTMSIARHSQVERAAHVDAELERVIAEELRQVANELILLLILIQRTVTASDFVTQARAENETTVAPDEEGR